MACCCREAWAASSLFHLQEQRLPLCCSCFGVCFASLWATLIAQDIHLDLASTYCFPGHSFYLLFVLSPGLCLEAFSGPHNKLEATVDRNVWIEIIVRARFPVSQCPGGTEPHCPHRFACSA